MRAVTFAGAWTNEVVAVHDVLDLVPAADEILVAAVSQRHPFERSVDWFVAAVKAGDPGLVLCPPAGAARTLAVAVAAEQALATGRTVQVQT